MASSSSRRKEIIKRTIIYSAMSVTVVVLVTILVFIMLGYQLNKNDGKIEQGGLVQFNSIPTGATVTIDGTSFGTRTTSKTTMTAGQHYVTMQRSGYQRWQKSINVVPGTVLWLNYARLVPTTLKPSSIANFSTVTSTTTSPDNKWMAIHEDVATAVIHLADLSSDTVKMTNLELPTDSYTHPSDGKSQTFSLVKWDSDSRFMLVKHMYDEGKTEWLVVDSRNAANTKNITTLLDVNATKVIFSGNDSNILYGLIGTDVRKIDLGAATLSRPLVANVADFSIFDKNTITYTSNLDPTTGKRSVGYYQDGGSEAHVIRTYKDNGQIPFHVALGKYFGDIYEAVAYGDTIEVLQGDLPTDKNPTSLRSITKLTFTGGAQYLSMVTEGRFVVAQNGATFEIYDLELKKTTSTTLKGTVPVTDQIQWIDGYMPYSDRDGMLRLYEFDGANQHDIMPVVSGFSATLSPNEKYIYGINKSSDGSYHLERVQMIIS